jgi:pilus assembly protein CpaB
MGPVRILILVVALAAALGAVVVVRGMSTAKTPQVVVAAAPAVIETPKSQVLVAKRDLPPGTRLTVDDMTWQPWPKDALNAAYIVNDTSVPAASDKTGQVASKAMEVAKVAVGAEEPKLMALVGAVVREPILAREPMIERKLVRAGEAGIMAISLDTGMRAMAIPLSAESAAGGFILPGDHVDVVLTHPLEGASGGGKRFSSETVLKNVRVLAIDQATATPKEGNAVVGATATLELNSKQAEVLALSKAQGDLTLVLRSYADAKGPAVTVAQTESDVFRPAVVKIFKNGSATGSTTEVTVTR